MNEKENTFRTLAEKPLLVKSLWCSFGFHRWTQWCKPMNRKEGVYTVDYQARSCASCNVFDVKTLRRY
jgi:hypothetical protein